MKIEPKVILLGKLLGFLTVILKAGGAGLKVFFTKSLFPALILLVLLTQRSHSSTFDLAPFSDSVSVLENPHKGWYHHYFDNGIWRYMVKNDSDLDDFPGMNHLYIRLAWSFFEPKEGVYNWAFIDTLVAHWVPKGYGISLCVTAKETRGEGFAVPLGSAGYATPKWVADAGAKGMWVTNNTGGPVQNWEPVWDDPIFLEKLSNFHRAMAARYDTASWLVDVVTGSIGDWGEGHTFFSSRISPSVATVKKHLDIYKNHYHKAQLVTNDDWITAGKSASDQTELRSYAVAKGFSFRDDSPLVKWHVATFPATFSIQHKEFFDEVWRTRPTTLECEHYQKVIDSGNWAGINGSIKGGNILRGAVKVAHATYIGYHAYADKWLADNPQLAKDLANLAGYWFFLKQLSLPDSASAGKPMNLSLLWRNRGASIAYAPFQLQIQLVGATTSWSTPLPSAKPRDWLPDTDILENYTFSIPANLSQDEYTIKVRLFELIQGDTIPIKIALAPSLLDSKGFYKIGKISIKNSVGLAIKKNNLRHSALPSNLESSTFEDIRGRTLPRTNPHSRATMLVVRSKDLSGEQNKGETIAPTNRLQIQTK